MRRTLEFTIYFVLIALVILRFANADQDTGRRRSVAPPQVAPKIQEPAVLLPEGARLPAQQGPVEVELKTDLHSGVGTAFLVDEAGTYITARHVVDGCSEVYFIHPRAGLQKTKSYKAANNRDFALIRAYGARKFHLRLSDKESQRGAEGFMMGYPQGEPADVRATVIGHTQMRSSGRYRMREPVVAWVERERQPRFGGSLGGISGGPVLDANGNVVGTVVAGAPRRGRVYTTNPKVFVENQLIPASQQGRTPILGDGINSDNYHSIGETLRASGAIRQVYCKVS